MIYLIEGPDGAGKTTLVRDVIKAKGAIPLPRNCTSLEGPKTDSLEKYLRWTVNEFPRMARDYQLYVLDRHPCISELIYGPALRGHAEMGNSPSLFWRAFSTLKQNADVIYCLPPWEDVQANLRASSEGQMPGVAAQGRELYEAYQQFIDSALFPEAMIYDYTRDGGWVS